MSFSSYANFRSAVTTWLNLDDTVSAEVDDLITIGENRVTKEVRHRLLEKALSTATASGVIAVPSDYVELKFSYVDGTPVQHLQRRSADWVYQKYPARSTSGKPKYIARETTNFIFGPFPDATYTIKGVYYFKPTALSGGLSNLFTAHPDLYLFACLAEAEPFIGRDTRIGIWEAKYNKIKDSVMREDMDEMVSGSPPVVTNTNGNL